MAVEASLQGLGCRFSVRVEGYSEGTAAYDANRVTGVVEVEVGERADFHARRPIEIDIAALVRFKDALKALDRSLNGEAILSNSEDFSVRITLTAGKGHLSGIVREWGGE